MIDLHNLIGKCQDEETRAWLKADAKNLLLAELGEFERCSVEFRVQT